jgi:hypothetical protein
MRNEGTKAFLSLVKNWANVPIDYLMSGTKRSTRHSMAVKMHILSRN